MKRMVLILIAVIGLAAIAFFFYMQPRVTTIVRTKQGFVPQSIHIKKGDTVKFVNETGSPFWPASNSHPSHGTYSEFDPKEPVPAGSSWSFTFTRVGSWGFHDHLSSGVQGTIVVYGLPGEGVAECLARSNVAEISPECWDADVTNVLKKDGLDAAFAFIDKLYKEDPRFQRSCHDVMHILGSAAYEKYAKDQAVTDHPEASYCGYGFYHGFIEKMLISEGPAHYDEVRKYCESLVTPSSGGGSGSCFHGIGHAIFDTLDSAIWGDYDAMVKEGTRLCEVALTDKEARIRCASGIHNSFANAMSRRSYELSYAGFDSIAFCRSQPDEYRETCFGEVLTAQIRNTNLDRANAMKLLATLTPNERTLEYYYYFATEVKRDISNVDSKKYATTCEELGNQVWTRRCISGIVQGIREESPTQKTFVIAFPFCSHLSGDNKAYCSDEVTRVMSSAAMRTEEYATACVALWGNQQPEKCQTK